MPCGLLRLRGGGSEIDFSRLSVVPYILIMLRFAIHADKGKTEEPEKVVLSDYGIMALVPIWAAMFLV